MHEGNFGFETNFEWEDLSSLKISLLHMLHNRSGWRNTAMASPLHSPLFIMRLQTNSVTM